jgi:hypothetical protein
MYESLKRPSTWTAIIGSVLAAVAFQPAMTPFFAGQEQPLREPKLQLELIEGFLVLWITCIVIVIFQQLEIRGEMNKAVRDVYQNLEKTLKLSSAVLEDELLRSKMERVIKVWSDAAKQSVHVRREVEDGIERFLSEGGEVTHAKPYIRFKKTKEHERIRRLNRIVESAEHYVNAVTVDVGDYFEVLWMTEKISRAYLNDNNSKARTVPIRRCFVVSQDVLNGKAIEKRKNLLQIIRKHKLQGTKMEVHVVRMDSLPVHLRRRSFLVCDDCVVSESYLLTDEDQQDGYVLFNDKSKCDELNMVFAAIRDSAEKNWVQENLRKPPGRGQMTKALNQ